MLKCSVTQNQLAVFKKKLKLMVVIGLGQSQKELFLNQPRYVFTEILLRGGECCCLLYIADVITSIIERFIHFVSPSWLRLIT